LNTGDNALDVPQRVLSQRLRVFSTVVATLTYCVRNAGHLLVLAWFPCALDSAGRLALEWLIYGFPPRRRSGYNSVFSCRQPGSRRSWPHRSVGMDIPGRGADSAGRSARSRSRSEPHARQPAAADRNVPDTQCGVLPVRRVRSTGNRLDRSLVGRSVAVDAARSDNPPRARISLGHPLDRPMGRCNGNRDERVGIALAVSRA